MAELELKETKKDVTQEFEPIAVNEEISVKFNKNITVAPNSVTMYEFTFK